MSFLTKNEQNVIEKKINSLLLQTNLSYPEDDLLDIIKALGIKVYLYDFGEFSDQVSGAVDARDKDAPKIYINKDHSPERRTFTLAHELGHYILHDHDSLKLRLDKFDYRINSEEAKQETEANFFAASLLMPKDRFLEVLKKSNSPSDVGKYFGVSDTAVRNRLRWLKMN